MKRYLLTIALAFVTLTIANAQNNHVKMRKTVRLIYPQWQGGNVSSLITEVKNPDDASLGYMLGAQLLEILAPQNPAQKKITIPISTEIGERKVQDGVYDRDIIARQTSTAIEILKIENPDRIITLGGECSVSVVPFTFLADKYKNDVAVVWIDAHPDITLPGEAYPGYHAMAVTALMGKGDNKILSSLPACIAPSNILFVGLRDWERDEIKVRQEEYGMKNLTVEEVQTNSKAVLNWIKQIGVKHVLIHFDMDVLDPSEIIPAVGVVNNGLKMSEVVRIINDINAHAQIDALTVAEPMPRIAINLRNMLRDIKMFGE